jgi:hypothetical protein
LRESERRFSDVQARGGTAFAMLDREAPVACNDYLLQLTGWQREESWRD